MKRVLEMLFRFVGFLLIAYVGTIVVGRIAFLVMRETSLSAPTKGIVVGFGHILGLVAGGLAGLRLLRDREPAEAP